MREDFQHILVERERIGSKNPSRKTGALIRADVDEDDDTGPSFLPMGRGRYAWADQKMLNENLRPLRNFLIRSVGRNWNKVYAEIRQRVDPRRAIGLHVLQHLKQMVHEDVIVTRGIPYAMRGGRVLPGLFVHPKTGILCNHQPRRRLSRT
jgi:hypothetical protein